VVEGYQNHHLVEHQHTKKIKNESWIEIKMLHKAENRESSSLLQNPFAQTSE
jgi:hypothetical protein